MKNKSLLLLVLVGLLCWLSPLYAATNQKKAIAPVLSLLLSDARMEEKIPSLALMVALDTDRLTMAWVPGSDGITPVKAIKYKIYLSTNENFTPGPANLKKTVIGTSQTEIAGLATDTLYYGKVVAVYSASTSNPSNTLEAKTYKYKVLVDNATVFATAAELGIGKYIASGPIYTFHDAAGKTPPAPGSVLYSEDTAGGATLRTVDYTYSTLPYQGLHVYTSDASLNEVLDRAEIYSSFQLFDVASEAQALPASSTKIATAQSLTRADGSQYSRIDWKNGLLSAEQTNYAYNEEDLIVIPQGNTSIITLIDPNAVDQRFDAKVKATFHPTFKTSTIWGGFIWKHLDYAHVSAKGTLTLNVIAEYDFATAGSVKKNFNIYKKTWRAIYKAGPVPVYQEITMSIDVEASAKASAKIKAMAKVNHIENIELGVYYDYNDGFWKSYASHKRKDYVSASLDILGKANAEIRVIPKVEVKFYKVLTGTFTVEPLVKSGLTAGITTNNVDFLAAHPTRLVQLTSFDASLGLEANVAVNLGALGHTWDIYPSTCVLGTGSCKYKYNEYELFSIPKLELSKTSSTGATTNFNLKVTDGTRNPFSDPSIDWEVFPNDATITSSPCTDNGSGITNCPASVTYGTANSYSVFASGYGHLGEVGRQFKEVTLSEDCPNGPQTVIWNGREWQRCEESHRFYYHEAPSYCQNLVLGGHSDWRLPTLNELKSLVVCTNGCPTPIQCMTDYSSTCHPQTCGDGYSSNYRVPTIDASFSNAIPSQYMTSDRWTDPEYWYGVDFGTGGFNAYYYAWLYVRCIRN